MLPLAANLEAALMAAVASQEAQHQRAALANSAD